MAMPVTVPKYTVEDLEHFPGDGNRYELLDGVLLVTPAPGVSHQAIAMRLSFPLAAALQTSGQANVFTPGAISFPPRTQLEPDILVVPARFSIESKWQDITEHWLAVEILSRSSRMYDREFKRDAYLDLGVKEVWLVDTREKIVEVSRVRERFEVVRDVIVWRVPTLAIDVTVDLSAVFAGLS